MIKRAGEPSNSFLQGAGGKRERARVRAVNPPPVSSCPCRQRGKISALLRSPAPSSPGQKGNFFFLSFFPRPCHPRFGRLRVSASRRLTKVHSRGGVVEDNNVEGGREGTNISSFYWFYFCSFAPCGGAWSASGMMHIGQSRRKKKKVPSHAPCNRPLTPASADLLLVSFQLLLDLHRLVGLADLSASLSGMHTGVVALRGREVCVKSVRGTSNRRASLRPSRTTRARQRSTT